MKYNGRMPCAFIPPKYETTIDAIIGAKMLGMAQIVREKPIAKLLSSGFVVPTIIMSVRGIISLMLIWVKMIAGISIHQLTA